MHLLLNIVFAILAGVLADWLFARLGLTDPIKVVLAVLVGIVIFFANLAAYVL